MSAFFGGGIYCESSLPNITNCTIADNSALDSGGGISLDYSIPVITNCILWNDSPEEIFLEISAPPVITYSDIEGGYSGTGNINSVPLFVNETAGNYHLSPGSPCIDTGTNAGAPTTDKDGVARPQDGDNNGIAICDMGAYEFMQ